MSEDRLPPHNREAERSILGSMLRDNLIIPEIAQRVRAEDFYVYGHQKIFAGMVALAVKDGRGVDYITLGDWLQGGNLLVEAGGHGYLVDLWDAAPGGVGNALHYADIVRKKSVVRLLIHACNEISAAAFDLLVDPDELLADAEKKILAIGSVRTAARLRTLKEIGDEFLIEMDRRSGRNDTGEASEASVSTGWRMLDNLTAGLFQDELSILAARPSKGKTLFAGCMARSIAGRGNRVLMCSLEQRDREIYSRLISAEGGIPSQRLRGGYLDGEERDRMIEARLRLDEVQIFIDDTPNQTVMQIAASARRLMKHNLKLILIDYLQLIQPDNRREPRHEQVGGMARQLKILARELHIPVVALAQVGRSAENRPDQRPRLADLKESGGIEEHADCVMFLHKPESDDKFRTADKIEVIVEKCRNGPTGSVFMIHDRQHFTVKEEAYP